MSKQTEILSKVIHAAIDKNGELSVTKKEALEAMKEDAIRFGEYLRDGRWMKNNSSTWIRFYFEAPSEIKTTEQLYELYSKEK